MTMYVGSTKFWSIFAGKFGLGQFRPKKLVLLNFGQKKWVLSILTEKVGFDRKN